MPQPAKRLLFCCTALLVAALAAPTAASASEGKPLEFGYINLPPFGYTNKEGEHKGYLVDVSRRVFQAMDQPVHFAQRPATRLYRQLDSGRTAFTLGAANLHRLTANAVESSEPAARLTLSLYRRKDTDPISSLSQLRGEHVVLMKGYSYGSLGPFFRKEANATQITEARTHKSALRMIQFRRADYLLNYQIPADTTIARNSLEGLERDVIGRVDVHFFVSEAIEDAQSLVAEWDHHLRRLKRNNALPSMDYYETE